MNNNSQSLDRIRASLKGITGIQNVCPIPADELEAIRALEEKAEKRSLMGLGKVINTGVREVLKFDSVFVALTNMEFDWCRHANLILKKGDQRVGEEVYDEAVIAKLSKTPNVWFMHKNFVIYKDLVSFPQDIMQKICHFELPSIPVDWVSMETDGPPCEVRYANPSSLGDVHLKASYFNGIDERGLGTILIGVNAHVNTTKGGG